MQSPFWLKDPTILFNRDQIGELWPTLSMDMERKLNAVTRLVVVLSLLGYLITQNVRILSTGLATIVAMVVLYYAKMSGAAKSSSVNKKEGFENMSISEIESNGFTMPTRSNPVMNVLLPEIQDDPNRQEAAPAFAPAVEKEINDKVADAVVSNFDDQQGIKDRLFRDIGDQFDLDMSMRQWYATPNTTVPNDQKTFADFCYGGMISCKEGNALACTQSMPPHWING
jgi:hypothetical protein